MRFPNGDMWRVAYPENTGPRNVPVSLDILQTEETPMATNADDLVYVNLYGEEVSADDPTAQTKYAPAELKALRKGGFFPKRGDDEVVDATADAAADEGTPVLNSGVGQQDAGDDAEPKKSAKK
jgi:hypothetical protein